MWATVVVVCALLSVAAVIVLKRHGQGLASVSSAEPPIIEQSAAAPPVHDAPEHMVELYKYKRHVPKVPRGIQPSSKKHKTTGDHLGAKQKSPNDSGGSNGLWAQSWTDFHENEENLMRLSDSSLISQNETVPIGMVRKNQHSPSLLTCTVLFLNTIVLLVVARIWSCVCGQAPIFSLPSGVMAPLQLFITVFCLGPRRRPVASRRMGGSAAPHAR